jgi:hypothetical protein
MAKDVLSDLEIARVGPGLNLGNFISPTMTLAGTTGLVLQADDGWHASGDTLVFPLNPGHYFKVHIPIPKFWLAGIVNVGLNLSSIFTELWIDRPHPQVIGTATLATFGLPNGGTEETSWVGGEEGSKKYKQTGYRWATPQPYSGGGTLEVGFLQAQYGDELSVITTNFEPVTIHLMSTTLTFAEE